MAFTTLISTDVLAKHLKDPAFAIIDCRFKLDDTAWGEREYTASHIPGAVYAHLDRDLSGMMLPRTAVPRHDATVHAFAGRHRVPSCR